MILAKLDKLSGREKAGLALGLLLFFLAAVDNFAARPILRTLDALNAQIGVETRSLALTRETLQTERDVAQEYDRLRERVGVASSTAEALQEFKGQIGALAQQTGVSILKMDHREPSETEVSTEFRVNIGAFEADFNNAARFLQEIWKYPGMLRVVKLSMGPGGSKNMVKGSMSVTKLMLKDLSSGSAVAAKPSPSSPN